MKHEEMIDKLIALENRFNGDEEVMELTKKLKRRFDLLYQATFTDSEDDSDEFAEMSEGYYNTLRENDPDDASIFQVMWFK